MGHIDWHGSEVHQDLADTVVHGSVPQGHTRLVWMDYMKSLPDRWLRDPVMVGMWIRRLVASAPQHEFLMKVPARPYWGTILDQVAEVPNLTIGLQCWDAMMMYQADIIAERLTSPVIMVLEPSTPPRTGLSLAPNYSGVLLRTSGRASEWDDLMADLCLSPLPYWATHAAGSNDQRDIDGGLYHIFDKDLV